MERWRKRSLSGELREGLGNKAERGELEEEEEEATNDSKPYNGSRRGCKNCGWVRPVVVDLRGREGWG